MFVVDAMPHAEQDETCKQAKKDEVLQATDWYPSIP